MKKRLSAVDMFFIESLHKTLSVDELARQIKTSTKTVQNYIDKYTAHLASKPDIETQKQQEEKFVVVDDMTGKTKEVTAKGPTPFTSKEGVTVMDPAAAAHADVVDKIAAIKNKDWMKQGRFKNCVHDCSK